jgi:transcriptional regulator with XRE-family HTH domain
MPRTLPDHVAAEVRAELGRAKVSSSELARRLGRSHSYLYRRLNGEVAFDVADLAAIAAELGVPVAQFMPSGVAA